MPLNKAYLPIQFITCIVLFVHIFLDSSFSNKMCEILKSNAVKIQNIQLELEVLEQKNKDLNSLKQSSVEEHLLCIIKTNKEGYILNSSGAVEKITGFTNKELENKNITDIMPENLKKQHQERIFNNIENNQQRALFCDKLVEIVDKQSNYKKVKLSVSMFNSILTEEPEYILVLKEINDESGL